LDDLEKIIARRAELFFDALESDLCSTLFNRIAQEQCRKEKMQQ
jgi:hypothetical protein